MERGTMKDTEKILQTASQLLEQWMWKTEVAHPETNRLDVRLSTVDDLIPIVAGLRVLRLGYLSAITGLDPGIEIPDLEVLYHFCIGEAIITLRLNVPRSEGHLPSLYEIIPSAESFERELQEMFGIRIDGLRNPSRLYLPDDWPEDVYPLRKDLDQNKLRSSMTLREI
jgi:NADH:ubiquinone oxidoreductase subunit C